MMIILFIYNIILGLTGWLLLSNAGYNKLTLPVKTKLTVKPLELILYYLEYDDY